VVRQVVLHVGQVVLQREKPALGRLLVKVTSQTMFVGWGAHEPETL